MMVQRENHDQSIIVSGESGAGKTVSAKYAMRYFATVGGSSTETQIEKKVLSSSPIIEAIGNAKTTRNDNSSRFGKFIEINFDKNYKLIGASMRTYLLEKSRVVFQANGERNYHIFYQLCSAAKQFPHLHLNFQESFHYLNQGNNTIIDGIDDSLCFDETVNALTTLGFTYKQQDDIFRIIAAILHLGNIRFLSGNPHESCDSEWSSLSPEDRHLIIVSELLGIDVDAMIKWLCHRKIVSIKEVILKPMTVEQATGARDALAKHIYADIFKWMIDRINNALRSNSRIQSFIGVLDIYGFETFESNSFEQFCINYANEKLQQHFNQHVFKLEQEEYLREGIEWTFIDFHDNQPCIDLIETKLGILDLLDEECRMPKGTDCSWTEKLYTKCSKSEHFSKPKFGTCAFLIHHFAGFVRYEAVGFLEKNKDTVMGEQIEVFRTSQNKLLKKFFSEGDLKLSISNTETRNSNTASITRQRRKTVGSQFRNSLNTLMVTLNATIPHYIRCIKPNDTKESFEYNPFRAVQQLRACGVLETVRISAAGFPSKRTYFDFFSRFRCLCKFQEIRRDDLQETCRRILTTYIKDEDKFKFGKTKVFFRAGQVAYLEKIRAEKQRGACILMQKTVRGFICRSRYKKIRRSIFSIQRYARGFLTRRKVSEVRRDRAAIKIQAQLRSWLVRRDFLNLKYTIITLQTHGRGAIARNKFQFMKDTAAAIVIQRFVRGYLVRRALKKKLRNIIIVQSCVRRHFVKKVFKKLKAEARSVEHVKLLNKGLEMKIISLQHKINELAKENQQLKITQIEVFDLKSKLEGVKTLESENKRLNEIISSNKKEILGIKEAIEKEKDEKMDLLLEKERCAKQDEEQNKILLEENERLRNELIIANENVNTSLRGAEKDLKHRLEQEKDLLLLDQDQDRYAYQKLLKDYHDLEQQVEFLQRKLAHHVPTHFYSLSNVPSGDRHAHVIPADLASDDQNIDFGYGSVKSTSSLCTAHSGVESIEWNQQRTEIPLDGEIPMNISQEKENKASHNPVDVGLVLKLQQKLRDFAKENGKLVRIVEDLEQVHSEGNARTQDTFKLQELEMENAQLKKDLGVIRETISEADPVISQRNLLEQFKALQEELERRREECIQLHAVLADNTQQMKSLGSNYGPDVDIVNEDGELVLAFEAQKKINRQLEDELQEKEKGWRERTSEWRDEIDRLQEEIQRQQRILSVNLSGTSQTQTEAYMQLEITRLVSENLDLQEKCDRVTEECRNLKKQFKIFSEHFKEAGLPDRVELINNSIAASNHSIANNGNLMPAIRKKERDYEGMLEFKKEDIGGIIKHLVNDLKPKVAVTLLPGLPAYILFMCIRYTDFINDDNKVRSLLTSYLNALKKVIKKREDFETDVLWLSNTLRLLHNMKQYSGDKPFQLENTPRQNEQCLKNFDLSEYRVVFSNVALWIFNTIIKVVKERIHALTVPALLEREAITVSTNEPRGRASSIGETPELQQKLDKLIEELTAINKTLQFHGVDHQIITQLFKQLFYFMCATALNNLLLRNELCHWTKGMQIRYNLSYLEQWAKDERLTEASEVLLPIVQAAQLLQARKRDDDVDSVCEMCNKLTANQIVKILNLYTPADEYETRVPVSFIKKVQEKLLERNETTEQLLMDLNYSFPVRFPFSPSRIRLEDIEVPEILNLSMLKKV